MYLRIIVHGQRAHGTTHRLRPHGRRHSPLFQKPVTAFTIFVFVAAITHLGEVNLRPFVVQRINLRPARKMPYDTVRVFL